MDDVLQRLPHRPPFLLLDRVLLLESGRWAVAVKEIKAGDGFLDATGAWPAVLVVEAMAQAAGLAAAPAGNAVAAVVASIDRCVCRSAGTGDELLVVARVVRTFGATAMVRSAVRVGTRRCAAAEIVLRFG